MLLSFVNCISRWLSSSSGSSLIFGTVRGRGSNPASLHTRRQPRGRPNKNSHPTLIFFIWTAGEKQLVISTNMFCNPAAHTESKQKVTADTICFFHFYICQIGRMQFSQPTTKFYVSKFVNLDILQFEQIQGEVVRQRRAKKKTKQKLRADTHFSPQRKQASTKQKWDWGLGEYSYSIEYNLVFISGVSSVDHRGAHCGHRKPSWHWNNHDRCVSRWRVILTYICIVRCSTLMAEKFLKM